MVSPPRGAMKAPCGGWSSWWRLCDTPTGRSGAMMPSCEMKINTLTIEWNMPKVPFKKMSSNLLENRMKKVASVT